MTARRKTCPSCGGDELSVIEVHEEVGATDPGVVYVDENGDLVLPGDFWFTPGDPVRLSLQCSLCDHEWKPRGRGGVGVSLYSAENFNPTAGTPR